MKNIAQTADKTPMACPSPYERVKATECQTNCDAAQISILSLHAADTDSNTVAFIDGANLHKSVLRLGWKLDYRRFRDFLAEQFAVRTAFLFLGYVHQNRNLYRDFRNWGYSPIFRPTCRGNSGQLKGNCDTDLAVQAIAGCCEDKFDQAVLVSGDGDFVSVTQFLAARGKLKAIVAPSFLSCSKLLRKSGTTLTLIESHRDELEYGAAA